MDDSKYYEQKLNRFKQQSKKPLVSRVNIAVLVDAININMDRRIYKDLKESTPKGIVMYLCTAYHYPIATEEPIRRPDLVLYALRKIIDTYYPCTFSLKEQDLESHDRMIIPDAYNIINPDLLLEVGYRKTLGDTGKYLPGSWIMLDEEVFLNGAARHLLKFDKGIIDDEEGGTHLSAAVWNLTCLYHIMSKPSSVIKAEQEAFKKYKAKIDEDGLKKSVEKIEEIEDKRFLCLCQEKVNNAVKEENKDLMKNLHNLAEENEKRLCEEMNTPLSEKIIKEDDPIKIKEEIEHACFSEKEKVEVNHKKPLKKKKKNPNYYAEAVRVEGDPKEPTLNPTDYTGEEIK